MRLIASLLAPMLALALTAAPLPALAEAKAAAMVYKSSDQENQDRAVVTKALHAASLQAAMAYEGELAEVWQHAPAVYPQIEKRGDTTILRTNASDGNIAPASLMALMSSIKQGQSASAVTTFNTYAMAVLLLGSMANERRDPRGAIAYLDKGLALQPNNLILITEKGMALTVLQRFSDALDLYQAAERIDDVSKMLDPGGEARLLRSKGFVLIELNRLDEAETAYQAALKLEPDHAGARGELDYIRKLRAGGPQSAIGLFTGDKAKAGDAAGAVPVKP